MVPVRETARNYGATVRICVTHRSLKVDDSPNVVPDDIVRLPQVWFNLHELTAADKCGNRKLQKRSVVEEEHITITLNIYWRIL